MVLSVINNKYKMKHSIDLLMYDSVSIFKNCMFDFSILWLWYVVMNNGDEQAQLNLSALPSVPTNYY